MKVLIFEWLCGGGLWIDQIESGGLLNLRPSMMEQGQAMLRAVSEDFRQAGHEVAILQDARRPPASDAISRVWPVGGLDELKSAMLTATGECDRVILIAPETDGCLLRCCDWLEPYRDRVLSPDREFIRLTSSKHETASWLQARGVQVPQGEIFDTVTEETKLNLNRPLVIKPNDGAGSESVQFVDLESPIPDIPHHGTFRIEEFISGRPVSVSVLCGSFTNEFLPPTGQQFDRQPFGHYIGTQFPLAADLSARAGRLARAAVDALPPTRGYIGIDMVLSDQDPTLDVVIEVNPRLTMSYVRLREVVPFNIAERWVMLQ